uniref:Carbamoyl phosphate synthase small chain n=1 Tax=Bangiopsis subsimplex TaxID=139980 RepID=A0A1C9CCG9_9RHOD|nr:carbamoyl-phosphate synthase arginine-specific small subunit [Bangiopsis subsimplex]AOM66098.1 carbamoyl-phosphate synthase arginine-specific small subunit [Bangiopsis subsimplex]ARO90345.1 carbamoyl phosphate synthase small subunit [Bangiopsis subsimplex]
MKRKQALLVLEDGTYYKGWSLTSPCTVTGEVVFTTGMTGYQEIMTDPSYAEQIVIFTYPEIGNTGINDDDNESKKIHCKAIISRNICQYPSNWRMQRSLIDDLDKQQIPVIYGFDTRKLTQHIRVYGSMNGCISNEILDIKQLLHLVRKTPSMEGLDLVKNVTASATYEWKIANDLKWNYKSSFNNSNQKRKKVVVLDYGVKYNILRRLYSCGLDVVVMPATSTVQEILETKPSGIMLSNGPGDPSAVSYAINIIRSLIDQNIPIFGICMGHQLLCLALGAETFKLKFGHRGINHPTGIFQKVEITSQNHGFAVNTSLAENNEIKITHYNLNDWTIAGIVHREHPIFSVQYHPEASPGPHDTDFLFNTFAQIVIGKFKI